jgi:type IV pilus assembly protein PilC
MGRLRKYLFGKKLLELPFSQIFEASSSEEKNNYWLIRYNPSFSIPSLINEMEIWFSLKPNPFPEILDHWEETEWVIVVTKEMIGTSLLKLFEMSPNGMDEKQILFLAPQLLNLFDFLYKNQLQPFDANFLKARIFFTTDGELKLLPSLLFLGLSSGENFAVPFIKTQEKVQFSLYAKTFEDLIQSLSSRPLKESTQSLLQFLKTNKAQNFEEAQAFAKTLQASFPPRTIPQTDGFETANKDDTPKIKKHHTPKPKKLSKPSKANENIKISLEALLVFTRETSAMIQSGIPLTSSLSILAQQEKDPILQNLFQALKEKLENGESLSSALSHYKKVFPQYYVAMVAAGEAAGFLDKSFLRISSFLEKELSLIRKAKAVLTYPFFLLVVSLGVAIGIVDFTFPPFFSLLKGFHVQIPLVTQIVMQSVLFIQNPINLLFVFGSVLLILAGIYLVVKVYIPPEDLARMKTQWDEIKLKLPLLGSILRKINCTRFCRTLATLYGNGVPIKNSLILCQHVMENKVFQKEVEFILEGLVAGRSMAETLEERKVFPSTMIQMVAVGEETGELAKVLEKASDYFDSELNYSFENLSSVLEPIIVTFLGIILGTLIISLFIPLYQIISQFKT